MGAPASPAPDAGAGNKRIKEWHLIPYLFSGAGGAVLAVLVGALVGAGRDTVLATSIVRGPTVTQYVTVSPSGRRPCSGTKVAGGPPYEPNNSIAEAYGPLKSDQPINGSLGAPRERAEAGRDEDFFAFCIGRIAEVSVQLRHTGCEHETDAFPTGCSQGLDAQLIDNRGEALQTAAVGDTTQTTLGKQLQPGRYYIRIFGGKGSEYELEVSAGAVPLQPTVAERH